MASRDLSSRGDVPHGNRIFNETSGNGRSHSEERLARSLGWVSLGLGALEVAAPGAVASFLGIPRQDRLIRTMGAREIGSGLGILSGQRPVGWMWSRSAGDVVDLAMLATALPFSQRRGRVAASVAVVGGMLALDMMCADRLSRRPGARHRSLADTGALQVRKSVIINASPQEVYDFWRQIENLPLFMRHVKSVEPIDAQRSHWVAKTAGIRVAWDAEIVDDDPGSLIAWRSIHGAMLHHAGIVRFTPADPRAGTVVEVDMEIRLPLGPVANAFSKLLGAVPETQIESDLRALKQLMETGEVATTEGQPNGRHLQRLSGTAQYPALRPHPAGGAS